MYSAFFIFYILFFFVAFINILTSIFLEKTMQLAQPDLQDLMLAKRKRDIVIAKDLKALVNELDADTNGRLTQEEFNILMEKAEMLHFFEHHGLDVKDADLFFRCLAAASGQDEVDVHQLVDGYMKLRGPAASLDLITMFHEMRVNQESNLRFQKDIGTKINDLVIAVQR